MRGICSDSGGGETVATVGEMERIVCLAGHCKSPHGRSTMMGKTSRES